MSIVFSGIIKLLSLLPLAWAHRIGEFTGWLFSKLPHAYTLSMEKNLDICLPELTGENRNRFRNTVYKEIGKTIFEIGALWGWPRDKILHTVCKISGEDVLSQAREQGKGVIIAAPHLGCWELVGIYCADRFPMTSMYRPPRIQALDNLVKSARQRTGSTLVPANNQGVKLLLRALKHNEFVGILPDQDPRNEGNVFADLFGLSASTPVLLPRLANKTGAAVIFGYAERLAKGQGYHLHFKLAEPDIYDNDPVIAATAMNRSIEACIRERPEQYQWTYKRFKTRPPGEAKIY